MRVLLIDDHALFRLGLKELLARRGIEVVGAAADCQEGLLLAQQLLPEVILLDMRMPQMNGLEALRALRQQYPEIPVVMLTTSRDERDLIESLQQGAKGYLLKDMEPDELVSRLQSILYGKTEVAHELSAVLARVVQGQPAGTPSPFSDLTPREAEILRHLAEGQSNKVIARNLGISDGTVKLHVKAILRKLAVHSRVEAAVMAVGHGLCERKGEGDEKIY